jgi:hypothetical protein
MEPRLQHGPAMDEAEIGRMLERASDPELIAGVYNYCDRWCERCPFAARCFAYRESQREAAELHRAPSGSTAAAVKRSLHRSVDVIRNVAKRLDAEVESTPEEPEEAEVALREHAQAETHALNDALVRAAREYGMTAWHVIRALGPIVRARGDARLTDAVESIGAWCLTVASKTYRAIHGIRGEDGDPDADPSDPQTDANGSAKVARVLIAQSLEAWNVLMEVGRATADGVPAGLVRKLGELDAGLAARFPDAMQFVRPGFDEPVSAGAGEARPSPALSRPPEES